MPQHPTAWHSTEWRGSCGFHSASGCLHTLSRQCLTPPHHPSLCARPQLMAACGDNSIRVWHTHSGAQLHELRQHTGVRRWYCLSPCPSAGSLQHHGWLSGPTHAACGRPCPAASLCADLPCPAMRPGADRPSGQVLTPPPDDGDTITLRTLPCSAATCWRGTPGTRASPCQPATTACWPSGTCRRECC